MTANSFDTGARRARVRRNATDGRAGDVRRIRPLRRCSEAAASARFLRDRSGRARRSQWERGVVEVKAEAPLRLKLVGVSKSFPGVRANDNVNLSVKPGEIHALLGENGAGKSTLVKMIYGILAPDEGQILFDGAPVRISNPRAARRLGIGMVFQHFSLFEAMTVLENIALGLDSRLSQRELLAEFNRVLETYHLKLDPRRIVSTLSVGERQRIEIVRALLLNPRLLIMDEPTSVLTPQEVEQLFETLKRLASSGCSILYISHKLHEIVALCDTATILRGGKVVATCDPKRETSRSMAEMMIGANLKEIAKPAGRVFGPPKLEARRPEPAEAERVRRRAAATSRSRCAPGEIFGVAGVAGNGQNELLERDERRDARAETGGDPAGREADRAARRRPSGATLGLCAVPEERNGHAAVSDFSLTDNASLTGARAAWTWSWYGLIDPGKASDYAERGDRRLHRQGDGPRRARGLALGRQSAEVHHGARDPAEPRGAGRLPADLGGRRRRGGGHPSGDRRSRRARLGGAGDLAGPRRAADALRHARRHQSRQHVEADEGRRGLDRGDRAADGRRARRSVGDDRDDRGSACASDLRSA